jgi:ABC-type dipeptide/oligopeptide/nickel transport system ATPase component
MTAPLEQQPCVLEACHITKTFPGVIANQDISLKLHRGEVLALLGENGAGKTALMNILYGLYQPDAGEILVHGEAARPGNSGDSIRRGIGMVHLLSVEKEARAPGQVILELQDCASATISPSSPAALCCTKLPSPNTRADWRKNMTCARPASMLLSARFLAATGKRLS